MLASITPLGERSRGFSWDVTAGWFAIGATGAGLLAGAAGGAVGSLLPAGRWREELALAVLAAALCWDATPLAGRLPSTRRQVNEDWMARYRGWVYGVGFGAQLGVGLTTVVTSAAIYATVLGTLLCGSVAAGAVVGGAFGATRAASLLPARIARDPAGLAALHRGLARHARRARWLVVAAELAAIGLLIGGLA
jgi:hypothetical protein